MLLFFAYLQHAKVRYFILSLARCQHSNNDDFSDATGLNTVCQFKIVKFKMKSLAEV